MDIWLNTWLLSQNVQNIKRKKNSLHFNSLKHLFSTFGIYDSSLSVFLFFFFYISNKLFSIYNFECFSPPQLANYASPSKSHSVLCPSLKLPADPKTMEDKHQPYPHIKWSRDLLAMSVDL